MPAVYSAVERFDPTSGDRSRDYIRWSGLARLREVVSLDIMLCPTVVQELTAEDWEHNVQADFLLHLFHDLGHAIRHADGNERVMVLALVQQPTAADVLAFDDPRFEFQGFDLVETQTGVSALVNCGGFDRAFAPANLSDCGLLPDLDRAVAVQSQLREEYPDEPHAACDLWAVWRMRRAGPQAGDDEHP